jgi:hypothetical protein
MIKFRCHFAALIASLLAQHHLDGFVELASRDGQIQLPVTVDQLDARCSNAVTVPLDGT